MQLEITGIPILHAPAWLSAVGVLATAWLTGLALAARPGIASRLDAHLLRLAVGLAALPVAVLWIGQIPGALLAFPWRILALCGGGVFLFALAREGRILRFFTHRDTENTEKKQEEAKNEKRTTGNESTRAADKRNHQINMAERERSWISRLRLFVSLWFKFLISSPCSPRLRGSNFKFYSSAIETDRLSGAIYAAGMLLFAVLLLLLLGPALAPPLNYDVLEYHLGVIPHYFEIGRIAPIPHVFYSAQPLATEMLFALAAALEQTPWGLGHGLVQWGLFLLTGALLLRVLSRLGAPPAVRPWLTLLFLAHPIVQRLTLDRLTDLMGALFLLAGWLAMTTPAQNEPNEQDDKPTSFFAPVSRRRIFLIGLLAGGALASKWTNAGTTGALLFFTALAWMIYDGRTRQGGMKTLLGGLGLFALGVSAIAMPWSLWLAWRAGNPAAPFAAGLFPREGWGAAHLDFLMETHGRVSPLAAAYGSSLFARLRPMNLGPPLLTLALLAALTRYLLKRNADKKIAPRKSESVSAELAFAVAALAGIGVALLLWGRLTQAAVRFLVPVVAASIVVLGISLKAALDKTPPAAKAGAAALLAFFLFPHALDQVRILTGDFGRGDASYLAHATGGVSSQRFLNEHLGATQELFLRANALPAGSRLMALGEARRYPFRRPVALSSVFDDHPLRRLLQEAIADGDDSPEAVVRRLRQLGYTHLLVNAYEIGRLLDFHPPPALEANPAWRDLRAQTSALVELRGRTGYYLLLAETFPGHAIFGPEPLSERERQVYTHFLRTLRGRAEYAAPGPASTGRLPLFWIAPLAAP